MLTLSQRRVAPTLVTIAVVSGLFAAIADARDPTPTAGSYPQSKPAPRWIVGRAGPDGAGLRWLAPQQALGTRGGRNNPEPNPDSGPSAPRPPDRTPRKRPPHHSNASSQPSRATVGAVRLLIGHPLRGTIAEWTDRLRRVVRDRGVQVEWVFAAPGKSNELAKAVVASIEPVRLQWPRAYVALDPDASMAQALGTPERASWIAWIDRQGLVHSTLHGDALAERTTSAFDQTCTALLEQKVNPLVGQAFGSLGALRPLVPAPDESSTSGSTEITLSRQPLTLFRWWTDGCPHCRASLPALDRLTQRFGARGLRFVAVYHPKRRQPPTGSALVDYLGQLEVRRAQTARDDQWTKLRDLLQRGQLRRATSVSFLVDASGTVRWVHAGPRVHPSSDPRRREPAEDYAELSRLVDALLPREAAKRRDR